MPAWLFGLTFSLFMRCIASGSILGLVTGFPAGASLRVGMYRLYVPVYLYGLRLPAGLAIVDLCGQLPCGKIRFHILEIPYYDYYC